MTESDKLLILMHKTVERARLQLVAIEDHRATLLADLDFNREITR
jgi:hypothetical protein